MEANEMPERIYLFDFNDAMVTPLEGDTVYVREDVFIEKAQDWIADTFKYDGSEDFNGGDNDAMSMLLDDFTEYIKQAMKDE